MEIALPVNFFLIIALMAIRVAIKRWAELIPPLQRWLTASSRFI